MKAQMQNERNEGLHFLHFPFLVAGLWGPPRKLPGLPLKIAFLHNKFNCPGPGVIFGFFALVGILFILALWACICFILAFWAFISFHFGLLGLHFLLFGLRGRARRPLPSGIGCSWVFVLLLVQ